MVARECAHIVDAQLARCYVGFAECFRVFVGIMPKNRRPAGALTQATCSKFANVLRFNQLGAPRRVDALPDLETPVSR